MIEKPELQHAIGEEAERLGIPVAAAEDKARRFAWEIASDYSYPVSRAGALLLAGSDAAIDVVAPGFSDGVIAEQLLLPSDIERIINTPQGHIFHGELALDQLFFQRPAPHYSDYRSPIRGLYQCGSSTHPGGGVSGIPGHNAAREILRDWRTLGG